MRFFPRLCLCEFSRLRVVISGNQIVVLSGPTGCGKSTQVPQYILDKHAEERKTVNIIVTQPRKIAASSLAKRVCQERDWRLGGLVGYQVGLDKENKSLDTRLLYVTTGVLKRKIIEMKHLNNWSHIILDEIHEREKDMDIVMLLCKKLLGTNSRGTKLILMSATLNEQKLQKYFSSMVPGLGWMDAPSLRICQEARSRNVISTLHYDQISDLLELSVRTDFHLTKPELHSECVQRAKKLIHHLDSLEEKEGTGVGGVLIFLPGIQEIKTVRDHLLAESGGDEDKKKTKWSCLPLHSQIPWEEQSQVFAPAPAGSRKIVLSTNIAESSVTVTDIRYVIDFGLTKNVEVDRETNHPTLVMAWASRSQLVQRSGRAGRVGGDGRVYVLLPQSLVSRLPEEHVPEIQRIPLTKVVLDIKQLDMGSPKELLELAMDPPTSHNLIKSIFSLKEMRALKTTVKGVVVKDDGDLTVLGDIVARLPLDVRLGKLIVLGHIFGVLDESVVIAAGLNGKSIFTSPFDKRVLTYKNKLYWADGTFNDCFAILQAYQTWLGMENKGCFHGSQQTRNMEKEFFRTYYLQKNQLVEMKILVDEIRHTLQGLDIESLKHRDCVKWEGETKDFILQIVLFGAFYPNYFTKQSNSLVAINANKLLDGRDPWNTVYFQGMKNSQSKIGDLYSRQIKDLLGECTEASEKIHVSFEDRKIFVEFDQCGGSGDRRLLDMNYNRIAGTNLTGNIKHEVYVAMKLRQAGGSSPLCLYPDHVAQTKYRQWEEVARLADSTVTVEQVRPPLIGTETLVIKGVAHIISPSLFWVYYDYGPNVLENKEKIRRLLSQVSSRCPHVASAGHVQVGGVFLAPSSSDSSSSYLRARIIACKGAERFTIFYIDYGHADEVDWRVLRLLPSSVTQSHPELVSIPGLALQTSLSGLKPARLRSPRALWDEEVVDQFSKLMAARDDGTEIIGDIFSVTQSDLDVNVFTINLETLRFPVKGREVDVKQLLLRKKLADFAPESFKSQNDHRERMKFGAYAVEMQDFLKEGYFSSATPKLDPKNLQDDPRQRSERICVQGPYSPLQHKLMCHYRAGAARIVNVDPDSVNSVLLDHNPSDVEEVWMVAGQVVMSPDGGSQCVRNTFWLPDQPGLGPLLTMVFAPQVEMRLSEDRQKMTGFIAGLGPKFKETGAIQVVKKKTEGFFPEHDLEIKFKVEVDNKDILLVNNLRFWLNKMMMKTRDGVMVMTQPKALHQAQTEIKKELLELLSRERITVDSVPSRHEYW